MLMRERQARKKRKKIGAMAQYATHRQIPYAVLGVRRPSRAEKEWKTLDGIRQNWKGQGRSFRPWKGSAGCSSSLSKTKWHQERSAK